MQGTADCEAGLANHAAGYARFQFLRASSSKGLYESILRIHGHWFTTLDDCCKTRYRVYLVDK